MEGSAAPPTAAAAEVVKSNNNNNLEAQPVGQLQTAVGKADVKMMDEELKMTNSPGEEASKLGRSSGGCNGGHGHDTSPTRTQGLLTSTFRNEKDGSKNGS